ncbi:MAG: SAM-dependent methyltransferase [Pseudomonadota bacterium]
MYSFSQTDPQPAFRNNFGQCCYGGGKPRHREVAGASLGERIDPAYREVVENAHAFLVDAARRVGRVDRSAILSGADGRLRADVFEQLAAPLVRQTQHCLQGLEREGARLDPALVPSHRDFAQRALHPLILSAPFVFRSYAKPLGYAGDYCMVNQIVDDPRQGPSTYFQIVNVAFLQSAVAIAHRNRIDLLLAFLVRQAERARRAGRPARVLNVGCGPAVEMQRFLSTYAEPEWLSFELVDFNLETLRWTRDRLARIQRQRGSAVSIAYTHESVQRLLKHRPAASAQDEHGYDALYCAGLFDYLSDKICARLTARFAARATPGASLLLTNVHRSNPTRYCMEHLLDWHLMHRDEAGLDALLPAQARQRRLYLDNTGVNVLAEATLA